MSIVTALVAAGAVGLARAPVPASSGPGAAVEASSHTHVAMPGMAGMSSGATVPVGGTAASAGGYAFVPVSTSFATGAPATFAFRIVGPGGVPVTRFAVVNDKPLHLIVARHDLTGFQHLHPTMAPDGTWTVAIGFTAPGTDRADADFSTGTAALVLGTDLTVTGPATVAPADPGFSVTYEGTPRPGVVEPMLFRVTRNGDPVTLQPCLGSYGHLVVLRRTDLGYLHIHPEPALADGAIKFWLAAPGPGAYRMFLDYQVDGVVHTADFPLDIP